MDSEKQKQYLNEALLRAGAFEEMVNTKGWEYIKALYQSKLSSFLNGLMLSTDKPITEFEGQRRELIGLKSLLGYIDNDLQTLTKFREEENAKSTSK